MSKKEKVKKTKEQKLKSLRTFLIVVLSIVLVWTAFGVFPVKKVLGDTVNPFIATSGDYPIIAAHRGGRNLMPENTVSAFNYGIENFGVKMLETDLRMTKDNELVLMHDATVERTSDYSAVNLKYYKFWTSSKVSDLTLDDLEHLNFAYKNGSVYTDKYGITPGLTRELDDALDGASYDEREEIINSDTYKMYSVVTIEECFKEYASYTYINKDNESVTDITLLFSVEIKDKGDVGKKAVDILLEEMIEYNIIGRVVVGTFNDEIAEYINEINKERKAKGEPVILCGASTSQAVAFVGTQIFGVNVFYKANFCCLQVPIYLGDILSNEKLENMNIAFKGVYRRAQKLGISVQCWTINNEDDMKRLINMKVDVIMTDDPDILYNVINELKSK